MLVSVRRGDGALDGARVLHDRHDRLDAEHDGAHPRRRQTAENVRSRVR